MTATMLPVIDPPRTVVRTCGNKKVGSHTVTTSRSRSSCPRDCDVWDVCYAANPTQSGGSIFDNVERAPDHALTLRDLVAAASREATRAVRFSVSGDVLRDDGTRVDREYIAAMNETHAIATKRGIRAWSYTHAWAPHPDREHVEPEDFAFVVRASCGSAEKVREAHARGWYAAVVVDSPADPLIGSDIDGRKVVLCPAQRDKSVTCETCCGGRALCSLPTAVVAFAEHGLASDRKRRQAS